RLLLHRARDVGQEAGEAELAALLAREGGRAVVHRMVEQLRAAQPHLDALASVDAPLPPVRLHHGLGLHARTTAATHRAFRRRGRPASYYAAARARAGRPRASC